MKYIADTNALIRNPEILDEYEIIIPSSVNREIEKLELTKANDRVLQEQIHRFKLAVDGKDYVYANLKDYVYTLDDDFDKQYTDNVLLQIAHDEGYGIITNDRALRIKCGQYKIPYINPNVRGKYIENKGFQEVSVSHREWEILSQNLERNVFNLIVNEYIIVSDESDGELIDIMKWNGNTMVSLRNDQGKLGEGFITHEFKQFKPFDEQQIMAVDSIFENQVTQIRGRAGSGKSILALNTAWKLVESEGYKLVIFVNPTPLRDSQELGFYKGDRLDKLMQTAVGTMLSSKFGDEDYVIRQIQDGKMDILPFVDLRGYDTGDSKMIVWILEAQNLTSDLMKLGLQRIGENTKVIIDGDYFSQVDKDIYASQNGMKRMSEIFRGNELYGEVELQQVHRSKVAELADLM